MELSLPHNWRPRDYQLPLWEALESGTKRAVAVWHRRAGKDLTAIHWCARQAFQRPGLYWHLFPTYAQGRKVAWEGMDSKGTPFLDAFPEGSWYRKRNDEMTLWCHGGSRYQVVGTDHIDRLVGSNPVGVIFSEYALQNPAAWELIRPILAENGGWAMFIYTPRGRNHGYKLFQKARDSKDWFNELLTVDDTGAVPMDRIDADRSEGMPEELVTQEYWCSWNAALVGSYYGDLLAEMLKDGRISNVPYESTGVVTTGWDLGMDDSTAIWFAQRVGREHRLIDYYEGSGVGLEHHIKVVREKPYVYGEHLVPFDINVRELGTGVSRLEQARKLGIRMRPVRRLTLQDGINATRILLRKAWLDERRCERGLAALREYVKKPDVTQRGPDGELLYANTPMRNWATHGADALRSLAVGWRPEHEDGEFKQPDTKWVV